MLISVWNGREWGMVRSAIDLYHGIIWRKVDIQGDAGSCRGVDRERVDCRDAG